MDDIRERIVETAYEKFAEEGPQHVSMATVAQHAGTEEAAIRALFVDHRGLLATVLDEKTGPLVSAVSILLSEEDDIRQVLRTALRLVHQFLVNEPRYGRIVAWTALEGGEMLGAAFARSFYPSEFNDRLQSAVQSGQLRTRSVLTAMMIMDALMLFPSLIRGAFESGTMAEVDLETLYDEFFADVMELLDHGLFVDAPRDDS